MARRTLELERIFEGFHSLKVNLAAGRRMMPAGMRITGSQWLVLGYVGRSGRASIKDVSEALGISSSAATQIVNELVKSGCVNKRRDREDARAVVIELSAKARKDMKDLRERMLRNLTTLFAPLSDREFKMYVRLTDKIIRAAEHAKPTYDA
jgi:DNA-binding MarR family transcriptional regulator